MSFMNYYPSNRMSEDSPNDRRTKVLNKLICCLYRKDILSENSTLRGLYLVKSYSGCYTIVFEMDGHYHNEDILTNILVTTVDKILEWWDITDSYNLDIECVTRGRRPTNTNYFELLFYSYSGQGNIRGYNPNGVDNFHPRFEKMCRWMYNNRYHEYNQVINRTPTPYDPYGYRENPIAQELIQQRAQYEGLGIQPGYSDYGRSIGRLGHIGIDPLQQQSLDQNRRQQMARYYNGGYRQEEPRHQYVNGRLQMSIPMEEIEEIETSKIKRMFNKIKIKW